MVVLLDASSCLVQNPGKLGSIAGCLGSIVSQSGEYFTRPWEVFQVHIGSLEFLKGEFKVVWTANTN